MIMYAVRTGTKVNLDGIRARGWRLLISAQGVLRDEGFENIALDNGAWATRSRAGRTDIPFDNRKFAIALDLFGARADWVACPDIVFGGLRSLEFSMMWFEHVRSATERVLIPVQDGVVAADVEGMLGPKVGIFIGGGDAWKEKTAGIWGAACARRGAWCHMGRANAKRRIHIAAAAGVTSIDGSGVSRFSKHQPRVNRAVSQTSLLVEPTE